MDDISIFLDKDVTPSDKDLEEKLGSTFHLWIQIRDFVMERFPDGISEWNYPGRKYGWSFRIKDKKRVIIYFLPRDNNFKVAFVFGQKAYDIIMGSDVYSEIKNELKQATKYAEGRGIRIILTDDILLSDIKKLINIKLDN